MRPEEGWPAPSALSAWWQEDTHRQLPAEPRLQQALCTVAAEPGMQVSSSCSVVRDDNSSAESRREGVQVLFCW